MGLVLLINFGEAESAAAVTALAELGLRAHVCWSGPQAYRWMRLKSVAMAWVALPMTGVEDAFLFHRLRRSNPAVQICLLVEREVDSAQRSRLHALGARLVLRNGIRPGMLAEASRGLLS